MDTEMIKRTGLEIGRLVLIAVLSYFASDLVVSQLVAALLGTSVSPELQLQIAAILTVIIKAIDRGLHDSGVAKQGIVRF